MEKLFDPELANEAKPSDYVFRLSIKLETGDERYKDKVNTGLWVGSGARRGSEGEFLFFFILFIFQFFFYFHSSSCWIDTYLKEYGLTSIL